MRLLSLIVAFLASGALAVYVMTYSVNGAPPAPVHPIVGKWQLLSIDGNSVPKQLMVTLDFEIGGIVVSEGSNNKHSKKYQHTGVYNINSNNIELDFNTAQYVVSKCSLTLLCTNEYILCVILTGPDGIQSYCYEKQ